MMNKIFFFLEFVSEKIGFHLIYADHANNNNNDKIKAFIYTIERKEAFLIFSFKIEEILPIIEES